MSAYANIAAFGYEAAGRRSSLAMGPGYANNSVGYGYGYGYGYGAAGRLQSLTHDLGGTSADQALGFAYNPASQIVTRTATNDGYAAPAPAAGAKAYGVNGLNQYTAVNEVGFLYDANGNLRWDGSTNYVYDAENRLVSASGAKNATLSYDPLGRLWQVSSGATMTRFIYDGDRMVMEYDGAGNFSRAYVHGPGADEPLILFEAGTRKFLHADNQGSIVAITDDAGNLVAINSYDEYGVPGPNNAGRFQYTGQTWIPELGLYYYKARFYSSRLGRFMQTDPIGYNDQINLYAYVGNDPIDGRDPSGLRGLNAYEQVMVQNVFDGMSVDLISITPLAPWRSFTASTTMIVMNKRDYSSDYTRDSDVGKQNTFWHELYHAYEISIGLAKWSDLASNQMRSGFGRKIYDWDPKRKFMDQNPEARAQYFANCMTGGSCGAMNDFKFSKDGVTITFRNGSFHVSYEFMRTGSRIPHHEEMQVNK